MASNTNDNERIRDGENDNEIVKESSGKYYDQNIEMIKLNFEYEDIVMIWTNWFVDTKTKAHPIDPLLSLNLAIELLNSRLDVTYTEVDTKDNTGQRHSDMTPSSDRSVDSSPTPGTAQAVEGISDQANITKEKLDSEAIIDEPISEEFAEVGGNTKEKPCGQPLNLVIPNTESSGMEEIELADENVTSDER